MGAQPQPKLYPSQRGGVFGTAPAALACVPLLVNLACSLPRPHCPALLLPLLQAFSLSCFPSFSLEWVSSCPAAAAAGMLLLLRLLRLLRSPLHRESLLLRLMLCPLRWAPPRLLYVLTAPLALPSPSFLCSHRGGLGRAAVGLL